MSTATAKNSLTNWYLTSTTLHPTPAHLRTHVTALANNPTTATLTLHFTNSHLTLSHSQLSVSSLSHLTPFTHLTLPTSDPTPYQKLKQFIYCTPVDLSTIPPSLVHTAAAWHLQELYHACFLVAETACYHIPRLMRTYIPLIAFAPLPNRFKAYFATRIAVDAPAVVQWFLEPAEEGTPRNQQLLLSALTKQAMIPLVQTAIRHHAHLPESHILPRHPSTPSIDLFWTIPLADLLSSQTDYHETHVCTPAASANLELTWGTPGANFILGLQHVTANGVLNITAAVVGVPCQCAHEKHNQGWIMESRLEQCSVEWATSHEILFSMFDGPQLRAWRETHKNCSVRVKVRVVDIDDPSTEEELPAACEDGDSDT